jgi:hypothetical protein
MEFHLHEMAAVLARAVVAYSQVLAAVVLILMVMVALAVLQGLLAVMA